ncbi:probable alpha-glucoside transport protein [Cephalotrichum gorgonifer]|uniref:Probable alpha-glucoside transport protein n=1 Tax=Cephalotrichum gorgonifer TaxID=2041049 RepID=A0AAE8MUA9_9PEZI|nr:probable alpha-glucoside transport protein [Cephalotrichum gorgonifer]
MSEKKASSKELEHHEGLDASSGHYAGENHDSGAMLGTPGEWEATVAEAQSANTHEHSLTVRQALKSYPMAVAWSLLISLSIIMEGYDTILIGSLFAYPSYARRFGELDPSTNTYQIPARWQSAMSSGPQAGSIIGALLNGYIISRWGYKPAFQIGVVLMTTFAAVSFFGMTVELQAVGQILCGIPWGIFATIGPAYSSELCPLPLRAYLTAYTNMCFATGQFIGAGVLQSFITREDDWAWRIPFGLQWMLIPFLMVTSVLMPESPWYLVRRGRYAEAEKSVRRLMTEDEQPQARPLVALMIHTNDIEIRMSEGTSYFDCFKGVDLRRTEIACTTFIGQITCGSSFAYSATYFFQQAGLSSGDSYKLNLGGTAIAFCGTIVSWFLMRRFGRRSLYLAGMGGMTTWLFIIGALDINNTKPAVKWVQSVLCIVWLLTFSLTIGPVGWAIPPEVSSTRLRSQTVVLARTTYYLGQIVANVIQPYMMNPTALNWKGKTGFFWCGWAALTFTWAFFRLPETKNRSYEELDLMFEARLKTRQFKSYHVNAYDSNEKRVQVA